MPIDGAMEIDLHRDELMPPGFSAQVVWFAPNREGGPRVTLSTTADLHRLYAPYKDHDRLVIYLDRDGGDSGSVWVHITCERAFVYHTTLPGGVDSYCRNMGSERPNEKVGFLLSNGQLDLFDWSWTVPREDGIKALDYFLEHGDRDPTL